MLLHETFKKDNSENTELTTWVFEGFVPTAKLVNGKAYSIISDHLGTPILAVDSEGNEVWNRQLDIYGRVKREIKASSLGDDVRPFIPFLYQGQYYDFETKLAYNRYRYYSPETGAYISQDPIGLAGGNPTLYGYVKDSNWWVDRFGLHEAIAILNGNVVLTPQGGYSWYSTKGSSDAPSNGYGAIGHSEAKILEYLETTKSEELKGSKLEIISMGQITKNNKQLSSLSPCDICDAALKDFSEKHEMEIIYKWEKGEKKYNGCK
nr:RHS repeat-associated core domain-containing protein [Capnocytophaga sputigena]